MMVLLNYRVIIQSFHGVLMAKWNIWENGVRQQAGIKENLKDNLPHNKGVYKMEVNAIVRWNYINNKIVLEFENCFTGEKFSKEYNTHRGAKIAETKFLNYVNSRY